MTWQTELQEQRYQERIAELEKERDGWHKAYKGIKRDLEQVQNERDLLRKENERLREALDKIACEPVLRAPYGDKAIIENMRTKAREALEAEPNENRA